RLVDGQVGEEPSPADAHVDLPVLAGPGLLDAAAELERQQLRAVADAERRDSLLEDRGVHAWRAFGVDRRRPAGEDQRERIVAANLVDRRAVRDELRVDTGFANSTGDQLGILAAEIDDQDRAFFSRAGNWERPS